MLLAYIDLAIVFHCLIFGVFFLFRSKDGIGKTNFYLGSFLILLSIISIQFAIKPTGWIFDFPYFIDLDWSAGFWLAPLYLWYVKEMTGEKVEFNWKQYCLLIPGAIAFIYFSRFYFKTSEEQLSYLNLTQSVYIKEYEIWDAIFYPYIQAYFIYIIVLLYRRRNKVTGIFQANLNWLMKYSILLLSFGIFGAIVFMLHLPQVYIDVLPLCSAILYMILIYKFLDQSRTYVPFEEGGLKEQKSKYSNSNLDSDEALRLNNELQLVMEKSKLYLQPDLTLQSLSMEVKTKPHYLSQIINQYHQKNFSDFVNDYRIREAKRMILENSHLKLEAIGYESGFNTKATFNAAFKKAMGCTPSEYRKKDQ